MQASEPRVTYTPPPVINRRKPIATYVIAGINVAVYLVEFLLTLFGGPDILYIYGVKNNVMLAYGQWWRLLTCTMLHGGLEHIAMNTFALIIWGRQVEALLGRTRFVLVYLAAGLVGSAASFAFSPANAVGASGAIFGLFGALLIFRTKHKNLFRAIFGMQVIFIIGLNVVMGFTRPGIDNFGHLGGLAGGYLATGALGLLGERGVTLTKTLFACGLAVCFFGLCALGVSRVFG